MSNIMKTKSMLCKVRLADLYLRLQHVHNRHRLCHCKPSYAIHINAKPLQSCLPRGRARNDAYAQGAAILASSCIYNMLIIVHCQHFGVGSIPWSPLARGVLARPAQEKTERSETDWYDTYMILGVGIANARCRFISSYATKEADIMNVIAKRVEEIASKKSVSMAQVALAWVMSKDRMFSCSSFRKFPAELVICARSSRGGSDCRHQLLGEVARYHQYVPVLLLCVKNC